MILSHRHKFIFIKTHKSAGTSLEIALSRFCGPEDIITPISPIDERLRKRLGYRGSQHYGDLPNVSPERTAEIPLTTLDARPKAGGETRFFNHISAQEIRSKVDAAIWNSYFKFCFVRNPWDLVISYYHYYYPSENRSSISEYLQSESSLILHSDFDSYAIDGQLAVDFVGRYETLNEDLGYVAERLNLPKLTPLPKAKTSYRKDRRHYHEVLQPMDRKRVEEIFHREIAMFGYQW